MHGQGIYDDLSLCAFGSADRVMIADVKPSSHTIYLTVNAPAPLPKNTSVALSWGHGMTPLNKDRPHSMLAIGWGPYIQIVVLIDHEDRDKPFTVDGYLILRQLKTASAPISDVLTQAAFMKRAQTIMEGGKSQKVEEVKAS
jgi:hypothetical protein